MMRAIVFDDKRSYFHTIIGILAVWFNLVFVAWIFVVYELLEYKLKIDKSWEYTLGDICEFALGLLIGILLGL